MSEKPDRTIPEFDRMMGSFFDLPEVVKSKPSTIQVVMPIVGIQQAWIVQAIRHRTQGDIIFVQTVSPEGSIRLAIPPQVTDAIHRQYDALTAKSRSKAAKKLAEERKAQGIVPGFLKGKRKKG